MKLVHTLLLLLPFACAQKVTDIQGPAFISPLVGRTVSGVTGVVTAKTINGFWIAGQPVDDVRVSNGLNVFTTSASILNKVHIGDMVSLGGRVSEYHSYNSPNDLSLTELTNPTDFTILSSQHPVHPIVLGVDRIPPTRQLSALDISSGLDGFLSVPNNQTTQEHLNATLRPDKFGLDFWESLEGQLVAIPKPVALNFPTRFREIWIRGDWPVTGLNGRGGLTMTFGPDGVPDANPETIIVGSPLDGTKNPPVAVGALLSDIVGIVTYQFGFYAIRPLTAPVVLSSPSHEVSPTSLESSDEPCILTIGDYNVENLAPNSRHLSTIADHIVSLLGAPDLVFLQEVQDNSGPRNDGTVDANVTLGTLVATIKRVSGGVQYNFLDVAPIDKADGGQPGGNIRQAYLYRPGKLSLVSGSRHGGALDASIPIIDVDDSGEVGLSFNPGRIDPKNSAWEEARKPLVSAWQTNSGDRFFTVNVHFSSKSGSLSTQGNARPPVNGKVEQRTSQANVTASFVKSLLELDPTANIIVGGDFNEFVHTRSVFSSFSGVLFDINEASGIDPVERYTYAYDQNTEEIDHIFITDAIKNRGTEVEHIHVNNWASSIKSRASDHDPTVARVTTPVSDRLNNPGGCPSGPVPLTSSSEYSTTRCFDYGSFV